MIALALPEPQAYAALLAFVGTLAGSIYAVRSIIGGKNEIG
jgi:hypothetical protein